MSQAHPPRIFISYSHKDSRLREQLEVFLARLKQQNVEIWSDTALKPGVEWDSKIRHQLSTADIILLLISPDFLASKYIIEKELQQVMERHENGEAAVIPIFLRPCDWKGEVFDKLQGLPSNGKPVTRWSSRDVPFTEIAEKIREIVNDRESKWVTHIGKIESTFQARVDSPRTSDTTLRRPMAWGNWEDLGGPINGQIASGPAVASWAANRLDCFAKGTDNHMWHRWWDGQWSNWEDLGGTINSAPAAVSWGPNRIDCFAHGMDNAMWHWWRDGQSSGWEDFGGPINGQIASGPAVASWAANRLACFAKGTDNHMWYRWWDGRWSNWEDLGGAINSAPAAVSWGPNRIDCFVRGMNNAMWHRWWA